MSRILTIEQRLNAFIRLGEKLREPDETLRQLIDSAYHYNAWFTPENTAMAVRGIGGMLNEPDLRAWVRKYEVLNIAPEASRRRRIGLVLAGNIPLVGFHDILSVLTAGHIAMIKLSSQDFKIIPHILKMLVAIEPAFSEHIQYVERLEGFDAVIATGSGNTSRYFEYYFSKVPNIIRKNRNSVAVLTGQESKTDLEALGHDIFDYFGLGCRNVSKIYVPEGYNFIKLFEALERFHVAGDHHKFHNNYDYNKSIFLLNKVNHFDNGFLLIKKDDALTSSLAVLNYEEYKDLDTVAEQLKRDSGRIQCIVTREDLETANQKVDFGNSQSPRLWDYADGIDTMNFLTTLQ